MEAKLIGKIDGKGKAEAVRARGLACLRSLGWPRLRDAASNTRSTINEMNTAYVLGIPFLDESRLNVPPPTVLTTKRRSQLVNRKPNRFLFHATFSTSCYVPKEELSAAYVALVVGSVAWRTNKTPALEENDNAKTSP